MMVKRLIETINGRIAHKLTLWVIVFCVIITLLTSGLQLYLEYRRDMQGLRDYFTSITSMQLSSLSEAVWVMDDRQIQAHLNGITRGRDIVYAAVSSEGRTMWRSGDRSGRKVLAFHYDLNYLHRDRNIHLGRLEIVASVDNLRARLGWTALVVFLINSLKTFLLAGCILLYFRFAVTRHLEKLAAHVINMDFRRKIPPLKLSRTKVGADDEFTQVVGMLNILQRRGHHAFTALEKSEMRLRLFFDATEEGIFGITSDGRISFANSACLKKIGYGDPHDIIGKKVDRIISFFTEPSEEIADGGDIFLKPLRTGKSISVDDGYLQVVDGPGFYAAVRTYPIVSGNERSGAVVFFNDISAQREMLKEKNLLSQAVRQSPLLIIIADAAGNIEYVNPGFERLTGYSLREVIGRTTSSIARHDRNAEVESDIRQALQAGEKWQGMYMMHAKDGSEYSFDSIVLPVGNSRGVIINTITLWLDITQKVELQRQLNHAQKMEAVGRLSASFAHEFGNPLLGVRSVIKDISERVAMESADRQLLQLAYAECERMKMLIRDFQRFQNGNSDTRELHDIHDILDNVLLFNHKQMEKHDIVLRRNYHEGLPRVFVCRNQITQVFLNLIINAVDSMAGSGGVLEIATGVDGGQIHIAVKDSGVGINEMEKDLIFEPFYTTKPEVQGTGLGLSVSYGIVTGHGGDISVSSKENEGSVFTVHLPLQTLKN